MQHYLVWSVDSVLFSTIVALMAAICLHQCRFWRSGKINEHDDSAAKKLQNDKLNKLRLIVHRYKAKMNDIQPHPSVMPEKPRCLPRWPVAVPVHSGVPYQSSVHLDVFSLCRYMPENAYVITPKSVSAKEDSHPSQQADHNNSSPVNTSGISAELLSESVKEQPITDVASPSTKTAIVSVAPEHKFSRFSGSRHSLSRASLRQSLNWAQQTHQNKMKSEGYDITKLPTLPGCEPDGKAAKELLALFPGTPIPDLVRFLIARKGDVTQASEMLTKANAWHRENFPLAGEKLRLVDAALSANCFFVHGNARDGTPVLYMRGALYDGTKAPPEFYVLAAAHAIQYALRRSNEMNVTVVVHAVNVPGAPNDNADLNFIKGFISVLSDNFPERLKRLAIFPFPWYGRAIWSILKVFVDKRTQNKVMLLSGDGKSIPNELLEFIDPDSMPQCCGGNDTTKMLDMRATLSEYK